MNATSTRSMGKRFLAAVGLGAMAGVAGLILAASPASAVVACVPVPGVDAVPATPGSPAVGDPTIPNPDYVPAVAGVYGTEYLWGKDYNFSTHVWGSQQWSAAKPGIGWWALPFGGTQSQRPYTITEPVDAVGDPTIPNPDYVPAVAPTNGSPAVPAILCEWYTWDVHGYFPSASVGEDVNWPQDLVGQGQISPQQCGVTYQQDLYRGTRDEIDAVVGDGLLTYSGQAEDHALVQSWHFVSSDACGDGDKYTTTDPEVWGAPTCEDTTVYGTQTVHHWKYVLNTNTHVFDVVADGPDTVTNVTRPATAEELAGLTCLTDVTLGVSSTPTLTEVTLAATGAGGASGTAALGLVLGLGGLGLTLLRRKVASSE